MENSMINQIYVAGSSPAGSEKVAKKQKVKNFALKNEKALFYKAFWHRLHFWPMRMAPRAGLELQTAEYVRTKWSRHGRRIGFLRTK